MEIKIKCPQCKFELLLGEQSQQLKECPVCKFAVQTEGRQPGKKILKDADVRKGNILND